MPNWVKNYVHVKCGKEMFAKIKRYVSSDEMEFDFRKIIPMPQTGFTEALSPDDRRKYPGDLNLYDWSIDHWGTKWNTSYSNCDQRTQTFDFETAWSAPDPVVAELAKKFPNAKFIHKFADEDIGSNCGIYVYQNGKLNYFDDRDGDVEFACDIWGYNYDEYLEEYSL